VPLVVRRAKLSRTNIPSPSPTSSQIAASQLAMDEAINGLAQRDHLDVRYAFDGAHITIDGFQGEDAPHIVEKLDKSSKGLLPKDENYLNKSRLYAQLVSGTLMARGAKAITTER
jgi:hypothetical protein